MLLFCCFCFVLFWSGFLFFFGLFLFLFLVLFFVFVDIIFVIFPGDCVLKNRCCWRLFHSQPENKDRNEKFSYWYFFFSQFFLQFRDSIHFHFILIHSMEKLIACFCLYFCFSRKDCMNQIWKFMILREFIQRRGWDEEVEMRSRLGQCASEGKIYEKPSK